MSKIYQDDIGTIFQFDAGSSLAGATKSDILIKKPLGGEVTWAGTVDGEDNTKVNYTTVADDLDQIGKYYANLDIAIPGWSGLGETATFTVYEKFE